MAEQPVASPAAQTTSSRESSQVAAPQMSLPKGGGAIRGIGEKFDGLAHALAEVAQQFNRSGDKTMIVPGDYLEVVAIKN